MRYWVIILVLSFQQVGYVTARLNGPEILPFEFRKTQESFLEETQIAIIKDEQFTWLAGKVYPEDFYSSSEKPQGSQKNIMNIDLPACEVTKGFWENPFTLLTMLVLTVGNIYECKTLIQVRDLDQDIVQSYETNSDYYGYTGLAAALWGPFVGAAARIRKSQTSPIEYLYFS